MMGCWLAELCWRKARAVVNRGAPVQAGVAIALALPLAAHAGADAGAAIGSFVPALAGGLLLGVAAALLLWLNGRIAGVSNITSGLLAWKAGDVAWRVTFLAGIVAGAGVYYAFQGTPPLPRTEFPGWLLAAAGLLVGFGTSFGSGCTSGHGICGLGRLSERSLLATGAFLVTGIVAASITRQFFGIY